MATHSSILSLGNLIERAAWKVTVHGVRKEAVQFSLVQSLNCVQLCDSMDCSPPVRGIFQAGILE